MAFSDQLRKLRQNQGLSQEQLADLVGATTQEVVRWEIGLARPERDKVLRLARLLGCKPEGCCRRNRWRRRGIAALASA